MNIVILKYILYTLPGLVLHWFTADRCEPVLRCTAGWYYIIPHREPSLQISAQQIGLSCICVCPLHGHLIFVPMMAVIQLQNLLLPLDLSCDSADDRSLLFWCAWNAQYSDRHTLDPISRGEIGSLLSQNGCLTSVFLSECCNQHWGIWCWQQI